MTIACFAYNRSEQKFFEKIAPHLNVKLDIIYINKSRVITPKAFLAGKEANLKEEIAFKSTFEKILSPTAKHFVISRLNAWYIRSMAHYLFMKYYTILSRKRYDAIMLWSGVTFRQSIATKAAKQLGLKTLFIENGLLPDTIVMDTKGVNYNNALPRDPDFYRSYNAPEEALPEKLIPRQPKKEEKFAAKEALLPKKYIFIPFQVDYDTQLIVHGTWIKDMRQLFRLMTEVLEEVNDRELHLVFKEHPSSLIDYPDLHAAAAEMERVHIINRRSTQDLIEKAEAVVTINSTVGIESLLLKKRVVVLGNAFYAIEGVTKPAKERETLTQILNTLPAWQPDAALREKFLKYLYFEYLVPGRFDSQKPEQFRKINEIIQKLQTEAPTPLRQSQT